MIDSPEGIKPPRAQDILVRDIGSGEALDFVLGCRVAASVITKERPDIVIFPQRGAGPIEWTIEEFLQDEARDHTTFVEVPIGSHIRINDEDPQHSGISFADKKALIEETISNLEEEGVYKPGQSKLMIIDEVQKGGTISQAAHATRTSMDSRGDDSTLGVFAFQDSRDGFIGGKKSQNFQKLAANEQPSVKTTVMPIALFTVDRKQLLEDVWRTTTSDSEPFLDDFITIDNPEARDVFHTLVQVYLNPERARDEIQALRDEKIARDLGATLLQEHILEADTNPANVRPTRRATINQMCDWWMGYANASQLLKPIEADNFIGSVLEPYEPIA